MAAAGRDAGQGSLGPELGTVVTLSVTVSRQTRPHRLARQFHITERNSGPKQTARSGLVTGLDRLPDPRANYRAAHLGARRGMPDAAGYQKERPGHHA